MSKAGVKGKNIAVICMHRSDAERIGSSLSSKPGGIEVSVCTIEAYQGSEADIVIVYMVSSSSDCLTSPADAQRWVVALTRGKELTFVVGDLRALETSLTMAGNNHTIGRGRIDDLKTIIGMIKKRGLVIRYSAEKDSFSTYQDNGRTSRPRSKRSGERFDDEERMREPQKLTRQGTYSVADSTSGMLDY